MILDKQSQVCAGALIPEVKLDLRQVVALSEQEVLSKIGAAPVPAELQRVVFELHCNAAGNSSLPESPVLLGEYGYR